MAGTAGITVGSYFSMSCRTVLGTKRWCMMIVAAIDTPAKAQDDRP